MTELKPQMILRYFTEENGAHYTGIVLKGEKILSVKVAGQKDKTIYESLIHWLASLPGSVTISDLDIKERTYSPRVPTSLKKDLITLKDIAPTYDLLRFLFTYESYSLKNSLMLYNNNKKSKLKTMTFVKDLDENLYPVYYNRYTQALYSDKYNKFGTTLEEIGFPFNADIYVSIPSMNCIVKSKFHFTPDTYPSVYDEKIAFIIGAKCEFKIDNNECYNIIYNTLKEHGYTMYEKYGVSTIKDSILKNRKYKYLQCKLVTVFHTFTHMLVRNYNPFGLVKISPHDSDSIILEELKSILKK
jgi:hypothetical protein